MAKNLQASEKGSQAECLLHAYRFVQQIIDEAFVVA